MCNARDAELEYIILGLVATLLHIGTSLSDALFLIMSRYGECTVPDALLTDFN